MFDKERNFAKKYFNVEGMPDNILESFEPDEWLKCMRVYHNRMTAEKERLVGQFKKEVSHDQR